MKSTPEKLAYARAYREKNKEKIKAEHRDRYRNNRTEYLERSKNYYHANKPRQRVVRHEARMVRLKTDIQFKLRESLRTRLRIAIKDCAKRGSAVSDLGCSIAEFKSYLESRFYPHPNSGEIMGWNNWSLMGWHIDHIKPLKLFDLTDPIQFKAACHYSNLQPLWANENWAKNSRVTLSQ